MNKEIIYCPFCNRRVRRDSWVENEELETGLFKTIFWCQRCQKEFTLERKRQEGKSFTADGYVLIKIPGDGWVKEHTYVWEKKHGKLPIGWVIHHINRIKSDNRLENLIAMPKSSHSSVHPDSIGLTHTQWRNKKHSSQSLSSSG